MKNPEIDTALETILDSAGMHLLLERLAVLCHEKADHVISHYQDYAMGVKWNNDGSRLAHIANQMEAG